MNRQVFSLSLLLATLVSCTGGDFHESKKFINGEEVSAKTLNLGKQVYVEYCSSCHGHKGDGNGIAAKGSTPPPRNFTQGLYKFGLVKDSGLPTDEDFHRIIKRGLKGTAMLPWDMSDTQIHAVTQYIKTFAPQVWEAQDKTVGTKIELSANPYVANTTFAIQKGKEVYHTTAQCQACHRAYVTKPELNEISKKVTGAGITEFDSEMYKMKLQGSEYYFSDSNERLAKYMPPDFTWNEVRSASNVDELAMRLAAGVTGTGMPSWKDVLTDDEIWAVAYYVRSLMDLKGTDGRDSLMKQLDEQP